MKRMTLRKLYPTALMRCSHNVTSSVLPRENRKTADTTRAFTFCLFYLKMNNGRASAEHQLPRAAWVAGAVPPLLFKTGRNRWNRWNSWNRRSSPPKHTRRRIQQTMWSLEAGHVRRQIARNNDSGVMNFAPDTRGTL